MAIETCPTCGNGMAVVRAGVAWCRRCGTVRYIAHPDTQETMVAAPQLVERCRELKTNMGAFTLNEPPDELVETFTSAWVDMVQSIHPIGDRT